MTAPLILTALFGKQDFTWLDALRRRCFPPGRNLVPAHLTLFHQLPPTELHSIQGRLRSEVRDPAPVARIANVISLGNGVAFGVDSPGLCELRARLADTWWPLLIRQDQGGWRPHVTVQNKVKPEVARRLLEELQQGFEARPLTIAGLALWRYEGGPWVKEGRFPFRAS